MSGRSCNVVASRHALPRSPIHSCVLRLLDTCMYPFSTTTTTNIMQRTREQTELLLAEIEAKKKARAAELAASNPAKAAKLAEREAKRAAQKASAKAAKLAEREAKRAAADKAKEEKDAVTWAFKKERKTKRKAEQVVKDEKQHCKNVHKCFEWCMVSPQVWTNRIQAKIKWYKDKKLSCPSIPCVYGSRAKRSELGNCCCAVY